MQKLLVIIGPTGTGKTEIAIQLAKKFNGEIVSADSRQVYLGMDIGTGKLPANSKGKKQKAKIQKKDGFWLVDGIPIYLYDVKKPDGRFSLAEYQQLALEKIKEIQLRGKLPILVGGTGLYIQAVTEGLKIPKAPPDFKLRQKLKVKPLEELLTELEKIDPKTFDKIDKNNTRRVIRALEVYYQTGKPFSLLREKYQVNFDILKIGLTAGREEIYSRNDKRVEEWFKLGFIDEVKNLLIKYSINLPAMTSLGYRQIVMYLNKQIKLEQTKQRIKFDFHGYIRRQQTWFRRDKSIHWFDIKMGNLYNEVDYLVQNWLEKKEV